MWHRRCDLFNKAYNHISDRIDEVYKELTKGKAAPMGGVAYLSLEDSEVGSSFAFTRQHLRYPLGAI
jgi:structural maintenance of chromosome 1